MRFQIESARIVNKSLKAKREIFPLQTYDRRKLFSICTPCALPSVYLAFLLEASGWIAHLSSSSTDEGQQMTAEERVRSVLQIAGKRWPDRPYKASFSSKKLKRDQRQASNGRRKGEREQVLRCISNFDCFPIIFTIQYPKCGIICGGMQL